MKLIRDKFWVLLACLLVLVITDPTASFAQPAKAPVDAVAAPDDRLPVRVRYPDANRLRELQTDRNYYYGRDTPPPENPMARFWQWMWRKIGEFLRSQAYNNVWQYVLLALIAGLVIYLLTKAEVLGFLFPKRPQSGQLNYENLTEDIHAIDFDRDIENAVMGRNFRLAVRLLYLKALKQLTDTGHIRYKPEKTNRQYVHELVNLPIQADFETLTRQFEFVWYGDSPVDEACFSAIRQQFQAFSRLFVTHP